MAHLRGPPLQRQQHGQQSADVAVQHLPRLQVAHGPGRQADAVGDAEVEEVLVDRQIVGIVLMHLHHYFLVVDAAQPRQNVVRNYVGKK